MVNSTRIRAKLALRGFFGLLVGLFAMGLAVTALADQANAAKARSLVEAAINMTDSQQAVKLLWQASDIDPTLGTPTSTSASITIRDRSSTRSCRSTRS
jgi:hypothetical protein